MVSPPDPPESFLEHSDFLHALAEGLVFGGITADDVVQETWVSALEHPPDTSGNLRGWLRKVARNHVLERLRAEERRAERERLVARKESLPSTEEAAAREELRRSIGRAVLGLPEIYRSVLLLRFYENLPPLEIARRLRLSVATVRTRLGRGLSRLRAELDRQHGKDLWMGLLLPIASGSRAERHVPALPKNPFGPRAAALGVGAGGVCASLVLAWVLIRGGGGEPTMAGPGTLGSPASALSSAPATAGTTDSGEYGRSPLAPEKTELVLRVSRDQDRAPVAGARLEVALSSGSRFSAISDEAGSARILLGEAGVAQIDVGETARSSTWREEVDLAEWTRRGALEIQVPAATCVMGRVLERGVPAAGADVLAFAVEGPTLQDGEPWQVLARTRASTDGEFVLGGLPSRFSLFARAPGLLAGECFVAELERAEDLDGVEFLLVPCAQIQGQVFAPERRPLEGVAVVARPRAFQPLAHPFGHAHAFYQQRLMSITRSAADGSFSLPFPEDSQASLDASHPGFVDGRARWNEHGRSEPVPIVLAPAVPQELLVRTESGEPIASALVQVFSEEHEPRTVTSDAGGRVELPGARADDVVLARVSAAGFATRFHAPIRVGRDPQTIEVRLVAGESIEGRVLDVAGLPLQNVRVGAQFCVPSEDPWATTFERWSSESSRLTMSLTDQYGRYRLENLEPGEYRIVALPQGALFPEADCRARTGERDVELVLGRTSRPPVLSSLRVFDASSGEQLSRFGIRLDCDDHVVFARELEQGADGVALPPCEPGDLRISLLAPGYVPWILELADRPSGSHHADVPLLPARSIRLRVVDASGQALGTGTVRCRDERGTPLLVNSGGGMWLGAVSLRSSGEAQLEGLPAGIVIVEVHDPLHSDPARFELDLSEVEQLSREVALPWIVPARARHTAILLAVGDRAELNPWQGQVRAAVRAAASFVPGTRAQVRVFDEQEREVVALRWSRREETWERIDDEPVSVEQYSPAGVLQSRREASLDDLLTIDVSHAEEKRRLRRAGLLLDAPSERCRILLSVDGYGEFQGELPRSLEDGSTLEISQVVLVESR